MCVESSRRGRGVQFQLPNRINTFEIMWLLCCSIWWVLLCFSLNSFSMKITHQVQLHKYIHILQSSNSNISNIGNYPKINRIFQRMKINWKYACLHEEQWVLSSRNQPVISSNAFSSPHRIHGSQYHTIQWGMEIDSQVNTFGNAEPTESARDSRV